MLAISKKNLISNTEGFVSVSRLSIEASHKEKARHRRELLGFVFQYFQLNPAYTTHENIMVDF